jgi:hypothetical protein
VRADQQCGGGGQSERPHVERWMCTYVHVERYRVTELQRYRGAEMQRYKDGEVQSYYIEYEDPRTEIPSHRSRAIHIQ